MTWSRRIHRRVQHPRGRADAGDLLSRHTWEDVSGHIAFQGLDGVKKMVELTLMAVPDCKFTHHGGMKDGNHYLVEWSSSGTTFDIEFACRGASVGETDDGVSLCTIATTGIPGPSR